MVEILQRTLYSGTEMSFNQNSIEIFKFQASPSVRVNVCLVFTITLEYNSPSVTGLTS